MPSHASGHWLRDSYRVHCTQSPPPQKKRLPPAPTAAASSISGTHPRMLLTPASPGTQRFLHKNLFHWVNSSIRGSQRDARTEVDFAEAIEPVETDCLLEWKRVLTFLKSIRRTLPCEDTLLAAGCLAKGHRPFAKSSCINSSYSEGHWNAGLQPAPAQWLSVPGRTEDSRSMEYDTLPRKRTDFWQTVYKERQSKRSGDGGTGKIVTSFPQMISAFLSSTRGYHTPWGTPSATPCPPSSTLQPDGGMR